MRKSTYVESRNRDLRAARIRGAVFLTTQTTSRGLHFASPPHYDLTAKFDNIGDLKVGAPVSMSGRRDRPRGVNRPSTPRNTRRWCSCG